MHLYFIITHSHPAKLSSRVCTNRLWLGLWHCGVAATRALELVVSGDSLDEHTSTSTSIIIIDLSKQGLFMYYTILFGSSRPEHPVVGQFNYENSKPIYFPPPFQRATTTIVVVVQQSTPRFLSLWWP